MLIPFVFFEKNASPLKRISSMLVVRETSSFEAWRKLSTLLLPPLSHPTFLSRSSLTQSIPTTTDHAGQWQTLSHRFFSYLLPRTLYTTPRKKWVTPNSVRACILSFVVLFFFWTTFSNPAQRELIETSKWRALK